MRVGERASVSVDADAGWGVEGNRALSVPGSASLEYEVELLAVTHEGELWDMVFERKMEGAEWRRARGVQLFKQGHVYFAHEEFLQGQRYLAYMLELTDEQAVVVQAAKLTSDLNCAASALKLGLEHDVLKFGKAALLVDKKNAKALYRMAQAHAALGDIPRALEWCDGLLLAHPGDAEGARLRTRIERRA
ncbi:hypothetical protein T492DRAFT_1031613, partial [Pavlovales sp. CCMP2436]